MNTLIISTETPENILAIACLLKAKGITHEQVSSGREVGIVFAEHHLDVGPDSIVRKAVDSLDENASVFMVGLPVNQDCPEITGGLLHVIGPRRLSCVYDNSNNDLWEKLASELDFHEELFHTANADMSVAGVVKRALFIRDIPEIWVQAADWIDGKGENLPQESIGLGGRIIVAIEAGDEKVPKGIRLIRGLLGDKSIKF